MWRSAAIVTLTAAGGYAQDWADLDGSGIRAALEDQKLDYTSGALQEFRASGRTLYNSGQDSWGYWRVEGERYCLLWRLSDLWACYRIQQSVLHPKFLDAHGDVTEGWLQ